MNVIIDTPVWSHALRRSNSTDANHRLSIFTVDRDFTRDGQPGRPALGYLFGALAVLVLGATMAWLRTMDDKA